MTESIQDQLSAFIDGELSADETEFLLRRLSHDSEARRQLKAYLAIGAAVRPADSPFSTITATAIFGLSMGEKAINQA